MPFDHSNARLPVPADLTGLFRETWEILSSPGNGWTGAEKVELARLTRVLRVDEHHATDIRLDEEAIEAVALITRSPANADRAWVRQKLERLGVTRYVELVGWTSIVLCIDVFHQLLGLPLEPLPASKPGGPTPVGEIERLRTRKAWVPTTGLPLPRLALSAVPTTQRAANRLLDRLYKPEDHRYGDRPVRGLSPSQVELIVTTVSHRNRCFYCTLGHLGSLTNQANRAGIDLDVAGIVDTSIDTGVKGGAELVALSDTAAQPSPDPGMVTATALSLGSKEAVTAAEVAAAFTMVNRIVEATGQPALHRQRDRFHNELEALGAFDFPHSGLTMRRDRPGIVRRVARKLKR